MFLRKMINNNSVYIWEGSGKERVNNVFFLLQYLILNIKHNVTEIKHLNEYFCHIVNFEFTGWVLIQNLQYDTSTAI